MIYKHDTNLQEPASYETADDVLAYLFTVYPTYGHSVRFQSDTKSYNLSISIETEISIRFITEGNKHLVRIDLEFRDQKFILASWTISQIETLSRIGLAKYALKRIREGLNNMEMIEKNLSATIIANYINAYNSGYSFENYKALCHSSRNYCWVFERVIADSDTENRCSLIYRFSKDRFNIFLELSHENLHINIRQLNQSFNIEEIVHDANILSVLMNINTDDTLTHISYIESQHALKRCYRLVIMDDLIQTL